MPDGGASVLRDMPRSPDALLWGRACRRIEGNLATLTSSLAASQAWTPGVRASMELLPFFDFEQTCAASTDCEVRVGGHER